MNIDGIHAAAVSVERANANHGRVECDVVDETSGFQQVETVVDTFNKGHRPPSPPQGWIGTAG